MILYARSANQIAPDFYCFFESVEAAKAEKDIPIEDFPFALALDFPTKVIAEIVTAVHYGTSYKDAFMKSKVVNAIDLRL